MLRWLSVVVITMLTKGKLLLTAVFIVNWIVGCASFRIERSSVTAEGSGSTSVERTSRHHQRIFCRNWEVCFHVQVSLRPFDGAHRGVCH